MSKYLKELHNLKIYLQNILHSVKITNLELDTFKYNGLCRPRIHWYKQLLLNCRYIGSEGLDELKRITPMNFRNN